MATPFKMGPQITDWLRTEGRQSSPHQADREFYENGAESAGSSQFYFFGFRADHGKLCKAAADDGVAMNRHDHLEHMLELFGTGSTKTTAAIGASKNKGVGARVASLAHNDEGVDTFSRTPTEAKRGEPWHLVRLTIDGLEEFDIQDASGVVIKTDNIVDAEKSEIDQFPDFIKRVGHGVVVVQRGDGKTDGWTDEVWKSTYDYMQSRYYDFPLRVFVEAPDKTRSDYRYEVTSLSDYYAKHVGPRGVVTLSDGTEVEWFVFDHTARGAKFDAIRRSGAFKGKAVGVDMLTGPARINGFRGVALRDGFELFNHSSRRLSTFNVIGQRATSRVSLIVTPRPGLLDATTNRQNMVRIGGGEIPFDEWGKEFGDPAVMPDAIKALMEQDFKSTGTISARQLDLLDPDWHKRIAEQRRTIVNPDGTLWVEPERPAVTRAGSSGGRRGNGPGPIDPTPGPNPGPLDGDRDGENAGDHHSADRRLAKKAKPRTATSVRGSEHDLKYLDLQVTWLNDVDPTGGPTWASTVTDPEAEAKGWAWFPGGSATRIYLRRTGDPFQRTLRKYLEEYPAKPRSKVQDDVESAYGIEVISKVVYVQDCAIIGWTTADMNKQFDGLGLSFSLVGLNGVEAVVEKFLRRTSKP